MGAKTNQVRDLYRIAGVSHGESPMLLSRYVDLCLSDSAFAELSDIARDSSLPAEIHHRLGEVKEAKVRAAWVSCPVRTREQLEGVFNRESRKAVQLAFAGRTDLWPEAYLELAQSRFQEVRTSVFINPASSLEALRAVMAQTPSKLPVRAETMRKVCEQFPELVEDLAGKIHELGAPACGILLEFHHDSVVLRASMARLDTQLNSARLNSRQHYINESMRAAFAALCRLAINADADPSVRAEGASLVETWAKALGPNANHVRSEAVKKFAAKPPERSARKRNDMLADARVTADAAAIASYVSIVEEHNDSDVVAALVTNPNTPQSVLAGWAQSSRHSFDVIEAAARIGDRQRIIELFALFLRLVGSEAIAAQPDPDEFVADLVSASLANDRWLTIRLGQWDNVDISVLERVPLQMLLKTSLRPDQLKQIADRLNEYLGDNETRYELFETLAAEMNIPLAEVLETCKLMAPDEETVPEAETEIIVEDDDTSEAEIFELTPETVCSETPWTQLTLV